MAAAIFECLVVQLKAAYDMPGWWSDNIFRQILQQVEYDEIAEIDPADLRDMAVMALQDIKPEQGAEAVLAVLAGDLSRGVRQNLAHEMKESRIWEEFANPAAHAAIFATAVLLHEAFPKVYPRPEIARLTLQVTASNAAAAGLLSLPTPSLAARLAAAGMVEHSTLRRMYAASLAAGSFPEAAAIIWQVREHRVSPEAAEWEIYSSWYWLRPLQFVREFTAIIDGQQ